jgi:hypothetical protein
MTVKLTESRTFTAERRVHPKAPSCFTSSGVVKKINHTAPRGLVVSGSLAICESGNLEHLPSRRARGHVTLLHPPVLTNNWIGAVTWKRSSVECTRPCEQKKNKRKTVYLGGSSSRPTYDLRGPIYHRIEGQKRSSDPESPINKRSSGGPVRRRRVLQTSPAY